MAKTIPVSYTKLDIYRAIPNKQVYLEDVKYCLQDNHWLYAYRVRREHIVEEYQVKGVGGIVSTAVAYEDRLFYLIKTGPGKATGVMLHAIAEATTDAASGGVVRISAEIAGATVAKCSLAFPVGAATIQEGDFDAKCDGSTDHDIRIDMKNLSAGTLTLYRLSLWEIPIVLADMP